MSYPPSRNGPNVCLQAHNGRAQRHTPESKPIPWVIIYYIGKWIMTRQPKTPAANC
jgi:hypothetical protein